MLHAAGSPDVVQKSSKRPRTRKRQDSDHLDNSSFREMLQTPSSSNTTSTSSTTTATSSGGGVLLDADATNTTTTNSRTHQEEDELAHAKKRYFEERSNTERQSKRNMRSAQLMNAIESTAFAQLSNEEQAELRADWFASLAPMEDSSSN